MGNFGRNDEGNESSARPLAEQDDYNAIDDPFEAQFMGGSSMPKLYIIPQTQDEKPMAIKDGTVQVRNEKDEVDEMDFSQSRTFDEEKNGNDATDSTLDNNDKKTDPAALLENIIGNNIKRINDRDEDRKNSADKRNEKDLSSFSSFKGSMEDVENLADDKLLNEWEKETAEKKKKLREFNENQLKNPQVNFLDNFGAKSVRKQSSSSSAFTPLNIGRNNVSRRDVEKRKKGDDDIHIDKEFQKVMKMADKVDGKTGVYKAKATLQALSRDWRAWVGLLVVVSLILAFTNALNYRSELVVWDTSGGVSDYWSPVHQQVFFSILTKEIGVNFQC